MPEAQLTRTSYLKYAFKDQHNLVLLFGAGCFSMAFATKTPLFVAASAEGALGLVCVTLEASAPAWCP